MLGRRGELLSQCLDGPATWATGAASELRGGPLRTLQPGELLGVEDQLAGARRSPHWDLIRLFAGLQDLTSMWGAGITSLLSWEFTENWHWQDVC